MTIEEIKNYLKDNLVITVDVNDEYYGTYGITVNLKLEDEIISECEKWFDKPNK